MKNCLYFMPIVAWSALCLGFEEPARPISKTNVVVNLSTLKFRAPADWTEEKPNERGAIRQYRLEPVNDDKLYGQVSIYSLGKESGQGAAGYVKEWKGLFFPPERSTIEKAAKMRPLRINGTEATYIDVRGDLKGIPGNDTTPRQNFRLLGVYLSTPQGSYVIRVLGPADTVEFYRDGFEEWLKALK